jgi:hypothetical protein
MITPSDNLEALRRRAAASITTAVDTCARSQALVWAAMRDRVWAERARLDAVAVRAVCRDAATRRGARPPRLFWVRGVLGGTEVEAFAGVDGRLVCPFGLRQRIEVMMGMGETFEVDGTIPVPAALSGDPLVVALSCMRALDQVSEVEFSLNR